MWGFSKLGVEDAALLDAVAEAAVPLIKEGKGIAQNLANLVGFGLCLTPNAARLPNCTFFVACLRLSGKSSNTMWREW